MIIRQAIPTDLPKKHISVSPEKYPPMISQNDNHDIICNFNN